MGYSVVGQSRKNGAQVCGPLAVLGEGKLKELATWTGGTGRIPMVKRKLSKAAAKWQEEEEEPEETEGVLVEGMKGAAQIVIVDTDLSPSQIRNLESALASPFLIEQV